MTWGLEILWHCLLHSLKKCGLLKEIEQREREEAEGKRLGVICEECHKSTSFPVTKKGAVQECSHCQAYVDVK